MRLAWLALPVLLAYALPASAQQRFGVELRGGASVPVGDFGEGVIPGAELSAGPSFAVHLHIPRRARGAILIGFAQQRFRCTGAACADAGDVVTTAWSLATRVAFRSAVAAPWIRLGVLFNRSEWDFPQSGGSEREASSLALGAEGGLGYTFQIAERVTMSPGVRYGLVNSHFPRGDRVLTQYVIGDLGVVLGF